MLRQVAVAEPEVCANYCASMEVLTNELPPCFLVKFGEAKDVVTNEI